MTRAEAFTLALPMAAIVVLCLIGWACERYIRRHPRNRYRKDRRWPTEGHTHPSYWSSARRFSQE